MFLCVVVVGRTVAQITHQPERNTHGGATRREETQNNNPPLKRFEFAYDTAGVRGLRTQQQEQEDDYLIFVLEELGS